MILEIAAVTLTAKALAAIICSSVALGGVSVGAVGFVSVRIVQSSRAKIKEEYALLDSASASRQERRQRVLNGTVKRVAQTTETMMTDFAREQQRTTMVVTELESEVEKAKRNQEQGANMLIQSEDDDRIIKELQSELKEKTAQLNQITGDYAELRNKLAQTLGELNKTVNEFNSLKQAIIEASGQRDYTGLAIERLSRMKSTNEALKAKLTAERQKYEESQQQIMQLTQHLLSAKETILKQQEIISDLGSEQKDGEPQNSSYTQRFF